MLNLKFYIMEETRKCKKCGKELPISDFDEGRHQCKECRRAYRRQHRKDKPEIHKAQQTRRQQRVKDWLYEMKTPCIVCGESEPVCIDFHHKNPEEKEFTISKHQSRSKEWLTKEISKCVCLCSNCHRKVHAGLIKLEDYIKDESAVNQVENSV